MIALSSFGDELLKIAESRREKELFNAVERESPVEVRKTDDAKEWGGGYFYPSKEDGHIGISDHRFDSLAHEIGHAKNHETVWGKLIQSVPSNLAYALSPIAGAVAGAALAKGKKWPMIIPAAAVAPVLLAEALATNTGHKVLKKVKAKPEEVEKYRSNLRSAFSTYLRDSAASIGVGGTLGYLIAKALKT
jgi:hypothetical protein